MVLENESNSVAKWSALITVGAMTLSNVSAVSKSIITEKQPSIAASSVPFILGEQADSATTSTDCNEHTDIELQQIFIGLSKIWKDSTGGLSVTNRRFAHPTYRAIIRLGKDAIPYILQELKSKPDWWFDALEFLSKENPAKNSESFEGAVSAWINWGKLKYPKLNL